MKINQIYTKENFDSLTKAEFFDLWFRQALKEKQIATLFGVTPQEVKKKRKAFNIGWLNSGIASMSGPAEFRNNYPKIVDISTPENWDGKPIEFRTTLKKEKRKSLSELLDDMDSTEKLLSNIPDQGDKPIETYDSPTQREDKGYTPEEAAEAWKKAKEAEENEKVVQEANIMDEVMELVEKED